MNWHWRNERVISSRWRDKARAETLLRPYTPLSYSVAGVAVNARMVRPVAAGATANHGSEARGVLRSSGQPLTLTVIQEIHYRRLDGDELGYVVVLRPR